ncbi:hypothetical protein M9458_013456, partial [Cirrhinus mrigala]
SAFRKERLLEEDVQISDQSEQDTSECTTAHSGTTTDRRSRSRSRRISLRKKLKLPIGMFVG